LTNLPGTELKVVGGPVCYPYEDGAYLWWQVQTQANEIGWSAEGSLNGNLYFLQPIDGGEAGFEVVQVESVPTETPLPTLQPTFTPTATPTLSPTPEPTPTTTALVLPTYPQTNLELVYHPDDQMLYTDDGRPVYQLDQPTDSWLPLIPKELIENSSDTLQLIPDDTHTWVLVGGDVQPLYYWDQMALSWDAYCPRALPSRITLGSKVVVVTNLNVRNLPEVAPGNWVQTHLSGTQLDVVGGPVCYPYLNGAYLLWQVQASDGTSGWSAEGSVTGTNYFLQPIE
jgi:hypothetical protein